MSITRDGHGNGPPWPPSTERWIRIIDKINKAAMMTEEMTIDGRATRQDNRSILAAAAVQLDRHQLPIGQCFISSLDSFDWHRVR